MPSLSARSMTLGEVLTPSATCPSDSMASSTVLPLAISSPTRRLRDCWLLQVAMRSPSPVSPAKARDLGEAPRDDEGAGVHPDPDAVTQPDRDRDDVLQDAAELAAQDV